MVRTSDSHSDNMGSIPIGTAKNISQKTPAFAGVFVIFCIYCCNFFINSTGLTKTHCADSL